MINPATSEQLGRTPLSTAADVGSAAQAASQAFPGWRRTPVQDRIQYLLRLRDLMKNQIDDLSRTITMECGKTFEESRAEMQRAIENIEIASGAPILTQGVISEDIAPGIDEIMIRQPVGVCAAICPFNFPGMIPFWFMPYALACGNPYIVKPSEKVPLTMQKIFRLIDEAGFPPGVVNLVNGSKEAVDAILQHPAIRGISFVGSTAVATYVYATGAANGKRVQAQGGAKNPLSWYCRTPKWRWRCESQPTAPSAAPGSAAWPPGGSLLVADLDQEAGSFHTDGTTDVHKGFPRAELQKFVENAGFDRVRFTTAYEIKKQIGNEWEKHSPSF